MGNVKIEKAKNRPIAHYEWEIRSFSLLENCESRKSNVFEAGGYRWSLILYPRGKNNDGNISLHLQIRTNKSFEVGWVVPVKYKFFVFNHKNKDHLIAADGEVKKFDQNSTILGVDELIALNKFKKSSKGYLVDDACIFGVKVSVKSTAKETLYKFKQPITQTLRFRDFRTLQGAQYSKEFDVEGEKWRILLYPKGYGNMHKKSLSIYLVLCDDDNVYDKVYVTSTMRVLSKSTTHEGEAIDYLSNKIIGRHNFMSLEFLHRAEAGFLKDDTLTVGVKIQEYSLVKKIKYDVVGKV